MPKRLLSYVSVLVISVSVWGGFVFTDDAWPFAPLRMFSYGNPPNGVVRAMRITGDTATGHIRMGAGGFGLRRSELEEQTPWDYRVPDEKLEALAEAYNKRHPNHPLIHLEVIVNTTQMRNGAEYGEPEARVIGDWATDEWTGPRTVVDLPLPPPWPGYTN